MPYIRGLTIVYKIQLLCSVYHENDLCDWQPYLFREWCVDLLLWFDTSSMTSCQDMNEIYFVLLISVFSNSCTLSRISALLVNYAQLLLTVHMFEFTWTIFEIISEDLKTIDFSGHVTWSDTKFCLCTLMPWQKVIYVISDICTQKPTKIIFDLL